MKSSGILNKPQIFGQLAQFFLAWMRFGISYCGVISSLLLSDLFCGFYAR